MKSKKIQKTSRKQMLSKKLFKSKKQMRYRKLKIKKTRKQRGGVGTRIMKAVSIIGQEKINSITKIILGMITPPLKNLEERFNKKAKAYNQIQSALLEVVNEKTNDVKGQIQDKLKPVYKKFNIFKQLILQILINETENSRIEILLNIIKNEYKNLLLNPEQQVASATYATELSVDALRKEIYAVLEAKLAEFGSITPVVDDKDDEEEEENIEEDLKDLIEKLGSTA